MLRVAVYGKSFVDASKSTWEMFRVRGWEVIINDQLTGMVLAMGYYYYYYYKEQ